MKVVLSILLSAMASALAAAMPNFDWRLDGGKLELKVAPGCYIYASSVEISARDASGQTVAAPEAPAGTVHRDDFTGEDTLVYAAGTHFWRFAYGVPARVKVGFQGCRSASGEQPAQCFLPQTLELGSATEPETAQAADGASPVRFDRFTLRKLEGYIGAPEFLSFLKADAPQSEASPLEGRGFFVVVLLVLLGGLGLNLTPCVLPMIPVNLAILGADGGKPWSGFVRGTAYGLGMALAYGMLGLLVLLTGTRLGTLNSSAFFNFTIALVFGMLSLAMFEVFNLDLSRFQNKVDPDKLGKGKILTAFILGAVAALLAGACVAPVVISVLLLAGNLYASGNVWALLLPFLLGVGMALPWPAAGAGLAVIPKPGMYMVRIKQFFGVVIMLAALYYAYIGFSLLPLDSRSSDPAAEIAKLDAALEASARDNRPLLIDFWATWCKNCAAMESNTLRDPAVAKLLESHFIVVKVQAEKPGEPEMKALLDELGISGLPAFVVARPEPPAAAH